MGKQPIDVGAKITADVTGFQKAAGQVKGSTQGMKKDIKETAGVFDELGGAIGGMGSEAANAISGILTAASGIGALVVVIGALAKAWQHSQENIELYLKSADKLKEGSGGFTVDAEEARVDVRKRANGQIALGFKMEHENMAKLIRGRVLYTEEQLKYFAELVKEGQQMQINGKKLRDGVVGIQDKVEWQRKYRGLLTEEEKLNDESLKNKEKWMALEADLVKQRTIIQDKDTDSKAKAEAVVKAEQIANTLLKEKNTFIDRQLANVTAIADMTATQEVVEGKVADLQTQKNTNLREYGTDMLKVLKMENKASKEIESQKNDWKEKLRLQKEFNTHGSEGFNLEDAAIKQLKYKAPTLGMPKGANDLRGTSMLSYDEIKAIVEDNEFQDKLEGIQNIVGGIEGAFEGLFTSISAGSKGSFADMAKAFARSLQQMAAQMAAKSVIFGILSLLSGGAGGVAKFATGLLGGKKFGEWLGFANGTNFAPGGLAMVGERGPELVNLPRGSQVIPNKSLGAGEVVFRIEGTTLVGVLSNQTRKTNSFR